MFILTVLIEAYDFKIFYNINLHYSLNFTLKINTIRIKNKISNNSLHAL